MTTVHATTEVAIVGAGPAGLLLGALLHQAGIDHVILERQSGDYVLGRIRAGVLEPGTVALVEQLGLAQRMHAEGLRHEAFGLVLNGQHHRIDLGAVRDGYVQIYGQTELTRDLMQARQQWGLGTVYEAAEVRLSAIDSQQPRVSYVHHGQSHELAARFVVGCDGFHGVCRASVPPHQIHTFEKVYPFGWLGVLSDTPPAYEEITYCSSERGFALASMRSPSRSRCYIQCSLEQKPEHWSDEAFWAEFKRRISPSAAASLVAGPTLEKSIAPLRSFVAEPMRFGALFLAGDAAHIVPPTGAKGLNLAASDVQYLAEALVDYFHAGSELGIDHYSERCLARVWKAERFSWWFTSLMHRFGQEIGFDERVQQAELEYLIHSDHARLVLAENYIGLER